MTSPPLPAEAHAVLARQCGVATLTQLTGGGLTRASITAQVDARRWQRFGDSCVLNHNFEPTREQWMWIALLANRGPAALAGCTALEVGGFRFFGEEMRSVHVVVPRGAQYHRFPGVKIHESRRFDPGDVLVSQGFPHLPFARSALDAGAWQPYPRYACGVVAAVVQQRICTALQLSEALASVGRVRHKQQMRLAIHDVAGGAEALSEIDIATLCRRFDIRPPNRQRIRRDRSGRRRYLDCESDLPDGSVVVLEVDGSHHLAVEHWEVDIKREREVVAGGRKVLRATAHEARYDQTDIAADLLAVGVPTCQSVGGS